MDFNSPTSSRRQFIGAAVAAGVAASTGRAAAAVKSAYGPFHMGIQTYTLRAFSLDGALQRVHDLGLNYCEGWDGHLPVSADKAVIAGYLAKLRQYDISMPNYGVVQFSGDEADARKKFAFGKAMGIRTFSAYPTPEAFPILDRLVNEYKINIAIHNHGPGDNMYDLVSKGEAAIRGHNPRIGWCIDTGHFLRSSEDPVMAARTFGKRVYGCHLKDIKDGPNGEKLFTEIGAPGSLLKTADLLKVLYANHFSGVLALEYEEHPEDPLEYVKSCLSATQAAVRAAGLMRG